MPGRFVAGGVWGAVGQGDVEGGFEVADEALIGDRLTGFAVALGLAGESPDRIDEAAIASGFAPVDRVGLAGDLVEEDEANAGGAQVEAEVPACAGAATKLTGGEEVTAG